MDQRNPSRGRAGRCSKADEDEGRLVVLPKNRIQVSEEVHVEEDPRTPTVVKTGIMR